MRITVDTNVWIAALLSQHGAAYRLFNMIDSGIFEFVISVPLIVEYEDVALRMLSRTTLQEDDVADILNYICDVATQQKIFYLWRPILRDPKDDMVLELAVAGRCDAIVTYNQRDFAGAEQFGFEVMTPRALLERTGLLP
jgi:putative PIN family toxin of toxin-antitoxin system